MQLVQIHYVKKNSQNWKTIDTYCFASKNLYNTAIYKIKQEYSKTGKFLRYNTLEKQFKIKYKEIYYNLPAPTSQQIMLTLDRNLKSYFALLKIWKKDKTTLLGCPKFPKYKDKVKGRNLLVFTNQQIRIKNGYMFFPNQCNLLPIKTNLSKDQINQVRIVPERNRYKIEIIYSIVEKNYNCGKKAAIDLGVNNLMTIAIENDNGIIYNGRPLKAINHYYNKKKAKIQQELRKKCDKNWSNKLEQLTVKRNDKIKDYLHKASRTVINHFKNVNVSDVVIGYNKEWKQKINIGSKNNQTFVNIPYFKLIQMLIYKGKIEGINVTQIEESYTSKCSSLDLEPICKHEMYKGKRIKRGLFETSKGLKINADVNASLNIGRKVFGDAFVPTNIRFVVNPIKFV